MVFCTLMSLLRRKGVLVITNRTLKKKRIQFDISSKDADILEDLVHESGATSMAEVLRNALNLYKFFVEETKKGVRIQVIDSSNTIKELILPGLNH